MPRKHERQLVTITKLSNDVIIVISMNTSVRPRPLPQRYRRTFFQFIATSAVVVVVVAFLHFVAVIVVVVIIVVVCVSTASEASSSSTVVDVTIT